MIFPKKNSEMFGVKSAATGAGSNHPFFSSCKFYVKVQDFVKKDPSIVRKIPIVGEFLL
jgi:hypothetical protein